MSTFDECVCKWVDTSKISRDEKHDLLSDVPAAIEMYRVLDKANRIASTANRVTWHSSHPDSLGHPVVNYELKGAVDSALRRLEDSENSDDAVNKPIFDVDITALAAERAPKPQRRDTYASRRSSVVSPSGGSRRASMTKRRSSVGSSIPSHTRQDRSTERASQVNKANVMWGKETETNENSFYDKSPSLAQVSEQKRRQSSPSTSMRQLSARGQVRVRSPPEKSTNGASLTLGSCPYTPRQSTASATSGGLSTEHSNPNIISKSRVARRKSIGCSERNPSPSKSQLSRPRSRSEASGLTTSVAMERVASIYSEFVELLGPLSRNETSTEMRSVRRESRTRSNGVLSRDISSESREESRGASPSKLQPSPQRRAEGATTPSRARTAETQSTINRRKAKEEEAAQKKAEEERTFPSNSLRSGYPHDLRPRRSTASPHAPRQQPKSKSPPARVLNSNPRGSVISKKCPKKPAFVIFHRKDDSDLENSGFGSLVSGNAAEVPGMATPPTPALLATLDPSRSKQSNTFGASTRYESILTGETSHLGESAQNLADPNLHNGQSCQSSRSSSRSSSVNRGAPIVPPLGHNHMILNETIPPPENDYVATRPEDMTSTNNDFGSHNGIIEGSENNRTHVGQRNSVPRLVICDVSIRWKDVLSADIPVIPKSRTNVECIVSALKTNFMFSSFKDDELRQFADVMDITSFSAGEKIMKKGRPMNIFYVVLGGSVLEGDVLVTPRLRKSSAAANRRRNTMSREAHTQESVARRATGNKKERITVGGTLGSAALLYGAPAEVDATAVDDVQCATLMRRVYKTLSARISGGGGSDGSAAQSYTMQSASCTSDTVPIANGGRSDDSADI